jgi:transposase
MVDLYGQTTSYGASRAGCACVEEGYSHRSTAARFRVSVKFVNDMIILKRKTGGLAPRVQGRGGGQGKLEAVKAAIGKRMAEKPDLTLNDLVAELAVRHGITIQRVWVWRLLRGLGLTHKKTCTRSSRSGLRFARRAGYGARVASPSCVTCCRAWGLLMKLR